MLLLLLTLRTALASTVEEALTAAVAERTGIPLADVEVEVVSAAVSPCSADVRIELYRNAHIVDDVDATVTLGAPTPCARFSIHARVALYESVAVASENVGPGDPVTLAIGRVARTNAAGSPVDSSLAWNALRPIHAGDPVTTANARRRPDVGRGAPVTLVVDAGALQIACTGRTLEDGIIGTGIRVWSEGTARAVSGTLVDPTHVHIGEGAP